MITTKYLGVCKYGRKFRTQLNRAGKGFYLGIFAHPEAAARAYDRASILTQAWSRRPQALNFPAPTGEIHAESEEEKQMLAYLQEFFPEEESTHRDNRKLREGLPDDALALWQQHVEKGRLLAQRGLELGAEMEEAFVRLRQVIVEQEKRIEWLNERVARAEALNPSTSPPAPTSTPPPTFVFKKVVPPAQIAAPVPTPTPEVQPVVTQPLPVGNPDEVEVQLEG